MAKGILPNKIDPAVSALIKSLEKRLSYMESRWMRSEQRIESLLKKIDVLETECRRLQSRVRELNSENKDLKKQLKKAQSSLDSANKQLAYFRKDKFGQKSEKNIVEDDENLAQAAERDADDEDRTTDEVKRNRGQQPGSKGHGRSQQAQFASEEIVLDLKNSFCPDCSKPYTCLPGTDDSTISELESHLYQLKYFRKRYATNCKCGGRKIITAPAPPRLYPRTNIGNNLWVHLCVWKFLHGVPTNRMLKDLSLRGLNISAGTITGGFSKINEMITGLYQAIENHCRGESFWNADETGWRVFSENDGKRNRKKWWVWVIAGYEAIAYILSQSRGSAVPNEFLAGSSGTLMSDRFSSYKSLPEAIQNAWCWVHVRRDFLRVYEGMPKHKAWAKDWLLDFSKLFSLHHALNKLSKTGAGLSRAWAATSSEISSHMEYIKSKCKEQMNKVSSPEQKTILKSLKTHWDGLSLFLAHREIPLENNRAERLLRPCVISRKNSYGSGVEWAGQMNIKLFSLFQTWLTNGLDPQALLLDYFNECSLTPGIPPPSIEKFLPWSMSPERKSEFALPDNYTRPA
ncbi:MAG: IS66 family transposase [Candidatus Obscuribacterales bacterium]|nr:IS66 family transposase [Candidatus Obscuribacterales bacterium]